MPTTAEIVADRLHAIGCRTAFGIPGGEVLTLVDALDRAGIRFVLVKNENAGGFMAQASCRVGGGPALLVATLGPGISNAVNAVASAMQDRIPMIVLAGRVDPAEAARYTHQVIDHARLFEAVTKACVTLVDGAVDVLIDKAIAIAFDGRPGPVLVDVPVALAAAEQVELGTVTFPHPAPAAPASSAALKDARSLLATSRRPLLIAGVDVLNDRSARDVANFVVDMQIPLITTYNAKGILPEDHPLSIGAAALSPKADGVLLPLVRKSDCIVCVGYDPIEMRGGWRDPWPENLPVIDISAAPNRHYMHGSRHAFVCDTAAGLLALREGIAPRMYWPDREPDAARAALKDTFSSHGAWGPAVIVETVRAVLPRDGIVTVDTGAHRIWASQSWECYEPATMLQSVGFGTMGCGLPLAIGSKIARPDRPVVAMTGDGGLEMVLGELATLRDLALPLVIVVFVDNALALIEMKQRSMQRPRRAVDFGATDFVALAGAMGGVGVEARTPDDLASALAEGLTREDTFTLIACPIADRAYDGCI